MSERGQFLLESLRHTLQLVIEHEKIEPAEVDAIAIALVAHVRSWKPMAMQGSP